MVTPEAEAYAEICESEDESPTTEIQEAVTAGTLLARKVGIFPYIAPDADDTTGDCPIFARFHRVDATSLSGYRGGRVVNIPQSAMPAYRPCRQKRCQMTVTLIMPIASGESLKPSGDMRDNERSCFSLHRR